MSFIEFLSTNIGYANFQSRIFHRVGFRFTILQHLADKSIANSFGSEVFFDSNLSNRARVKSDVEINHPNNLVIHDGAIKISNRIFVHFE